EAAKRKRIEAVVAKYQAAFAPEQVGGLTYLPEGARKTYLVTGSTEGERGVWGTDKYTQSSSFSKSVVHAGLLKPGETGIVEVTGTPPARDYRGSPRNGIDSGSSSGAAYGDEGYTMRLLERIPSE